MMRQVGVWYIWIQIKRAAKVSAVYLNTLHGTEQCIALQNSSDLLNSEKKGN